MKFELKKINEQTKNEIKASATLAAKTLIDEGLLKPEDSLVLAKKLIEYCTSFIKGLDSDVRAEVDKNGGLDINGVKLTLSSTGIRLSYEDDSVYKELKGKLKAREELLKTVHKQKLEVADGDTGEMVPIVGIKIPSKETLMVKF